MRDCNSLEDTAPSLGSSLKEEEVEEKAKSYFGAFDYLSQVDSSG